MNEGSSRSHLITTFTIVDINKVQNQKIFKGAKLNLVDLAGSERTKDSGVTGEAFKEATKINLSLNALSAVVNALTKPEKERGIVPYNGSSLTKLLADSLGGNCVTTLLACVSPSQNFCKESHQTLKFAHSCKKIQNVVRSNEYKGSIPQGLPFQYKAPRTMDALKQGKVPWDDIAKKIDKEKMIFEEVLKIPKFGKISVFRAGDKDCNKVVLWSRFTNMDHIVPALLYSGFQTISIDQPGYGNSDGDKWPTRCSEILKAGGPADVTMAVIQHLGLGDKEIVLSGYDWTTSISLLLAAKHPNKFSKVIAFHPSLPNSQDNQALLRKIKIPVLLQWVPADSFHKLSIWKPLIACIKDCTFDSIKIHPWNAECAKGSYRKFSNQICFPIVKFLCGEDHNTAPKEAFKAKPQAMVDAKGKNVTAMDNIIFADQLTDEDIKKIMEQPDLCKDALEAYQTKLTYQEVVTALRQKMSNKGELVLNVLRTAPPMTQETMQDPGTVLLKYGIWPKDCLRGWEDMLDSPRYFPGRQILVKANVNIDIDSPNYSSYDTTVQEKFVTHNAILQGMEDGKFIVKIKGFETPIFVPVKETLELNQGHVFAHDVVGNIVLEDSLVFNVKGHAEKAKLLEMAYKLRPVVEKLDFNSEDQGYKCQIEALKVIRGCLDFIANNVGKEKIMHPDRLTTGTVGKISLHGQGNCHGCSSVLSSYLDHFKTLLGFDVKYRSGYSFHPDEIPNDKVHPVMDKHQTVEVTLRPSMRSVIVDLWYEGVHQEAKWICMPVEEFYQVKFYPNCMLKLGCQSQKINQQTDFRF